MSINEIIPDESAILELRGRQADEILAELASALARRSAQDPELLLEQLREREALGSTATGRGLALPHIKADVSRTFGVLGLVRAESTTVPPTARRSGCFWPWSRRRSRASTCAPSLM